MFKKAKIDNSCYYGKDKQVYFDGKAYLLDILKRGDYLTLEEACERFLNDGLSPEGEYLANFLVQAELPEDIELIIIKEYNRQKKIKNEYSDKIKAKKAFIIKQYK